jgi:hypothetical protein
LIGLLRSCALGLDGPCYRTLLNFVHQILQAISRDFVKNPDTKLSFIPRKFERYRQHGHKKKYGILSTRRFFLTLCRLTLLILTNNLLCGCTVTNVRGNNGCRGKFSYNQLCGFSSKHEKNCMKCLGILPQV